ncbi:MAG: NADH-quinone oxidoreductase subunit NuoN [Verrucomicrobiaceae bacterium]|jgi:NADH-quinone oxidoreductase subunit N|nr:NADH-quinone oxidoreductase subunit N [bacterium]MDC0504537.1 NADH-quinone oxidoreductase subunit N [Verrucomicrobiales bacterium]MDF1787026.1 NADH-quinone oxidoreductase subunit N [Verrucomicrobiales bacterium]NCF91887.1 NADH-quinone oxidoreductase subunit NuoN [Verrucomicrobiaceae bacterium]
MPAYYLEAAVVVLGIVLMLMEAFVDKADKSFVGKVGIVGLGVIFLGLFMVKSPADGDTSAIWSFYAVDATSLFYKGFALITTIIVLVMSLDYRGVIQHYMGADQEKPQAGLGEFLYLPLFTCAGLMWMASAKDIVSIFVSLELVTISFYILVAFLRRNVGSLEAGVKYLILGALSTGFLVYGLTWLFGLSGETGLAEIAAELGNEDSPMNAHPQALLFALALIIVALGFKVAAVPFQIWVPDVYQGAPTPITAFLSVGSKAAGFVVGFRIMEPFIASDAAPQLVTLILAIAGATILLGNLAAVSQSNFKRMLAYSSISHAGFLLLALGCARAAGDDVQVEGVMALYLSGYLAMTLIVFHVMCLVRDQLGGEEISTYNGLSKRSPFLAGILLVAMVSLAGVPFTAGFFGKFYVFLLAIQSRFYVIIAVAVIGVGAGFYYYLKVVKAMYWEEADDDRQVRVPPLAKGALIVLAVIIFVLGVYPSPILEFFS